MALIIGFSAAARRRGAARRPPRRRARLTREKFWRFSFRVHGAFGPRGRSQRGSSSVPPRQRFDK
eukprot:2645309-Prymnesium_polylepis.1